MRPKGSAPHPRSVGLAELGPLPALRAARADALYAHLIENGGASYWEIAADLIDNGGGWTHEALDRAIDDIAHDDRALVSGERGYVEILPLLSLEEAA